MRLYSGDAVDGAVSQEEQLVGDFIAGRKSVAGYDWLGERYRELLLGEGLPEAQVYDLALRLQSATESLLRARQNADSCLDQLAWLDEKQRHESCC